MHCDVEERDVKIPSQGRTLDCYLTLPSQARGKLPAIVVIHEIFGPDSHIRDVTRRFAARGYVGVAPNLFTGEIERLLTPENIGLAMQAFAHAPPDLRRDPSKMGEFVAAQPPERRPVLEAFGKVMEPAVQAGFAQDLLAVTHYLATLPQVDPERIGSVGFCFGGGLSARLATVDPKLRAAVIFYGRNPPLVDVPKIHAKVLGLYGSEDPGITGTVPELAEAMNKAGKSFEYRIYPGARHAFFNDTRSPAYHEASAQDAWARVLAFYSDTLGRAESGPREPP